MRVKSVSKDLSNRDDLQQGIIGLTESICSEILEKKSNYLKNQPELRKLTIQRSLTKRQTDVQKVQKNQLANKEPPPEGKIWIIRDAKIVLANVSKNVRNPWVLNSGTSGAYA